MNGRISISAVIVLICVTGCNDQKPPVVSVYLDTTGYRPSVDFDPLAKVLSEGVSGGRVDMKDYRVFELEETLSRQLKTLAVTGPSASPRLLSQHEQFLSFWLNARTAWTYRFVVLRNEARDKGRLPPVPGEFPLDGRRMTLEQIDAEILRLGGYVFLLAVPGLSPDRAPLPKEPFRPELLARQSRDNFNAFIDDPRRVVIDIQNRAILFPPLIWKYRDRFVQAYSNNFGYQEQAPLPTALLPVTSGSARRRLQDAIGYSCASK